MNATLDTLSRAVTARPWLTIAVLLAVTVVLGAGGARRAPVVEGAALAFLPPSNPILEASREIDEGFGDSGDVSLVTLIFRGDALTPDGLAQMDALIGRIVGDPLAGELLAPGDAVAAPSLVIAAALQRDNLGGIARAEIDAALAAPPIAGALAAMTGTDAHGSPVAIATISLINTDDERVENAERRINELAAADEGPLAVSSISAVVVEDEYKKATEEGMAPLIGMALLLIALLLLVFLRTGSDLALTLTGLFLSLIWVIGAEGWLGPNGVGLIGPPSSLSAMVPIILISLTVDYAIQTVSHYREQRTAGLPVLAAVRAGLRTVTVPVALAAVTTMAGLLASLFSPISVVGDFGIVAALGVGMSLIVMLTLLPAGRTIIDRRREARGTLTAPRPVANALPGVGRLAEVLGSSVTRWPAPYFAAVIAVTIAMGFAATRLESGFSISDILPRGGTVLADMNTLEAAVGGSTEITSVLVRAEATETRTLLNVLDLTAAFEDEATRPRGAAGPIQASYGLILRDWIEDSGTPSDQYDPAIAALYREATASLHVDAALMQEILDALAARDPAVAHVLVNDPVGDDRILIQFPAFTDDPDATKALQGDIEELWYGEGGVQDEHAAVTAISPGIIAVAVTDEITSRQTEAISATIAVAVGVLAVFFWATVRQPVLAFIAVGPIVVVLIWVLGTMALLGIPYTLITSIITALSIGIGVDYTIHVIHRYREEYAHHRDPERAAIRTLGTTGSALLGSAATTALGLGVLVASPLAASQQFGITAAITIAYSLLVSILVVPPAMTVWGAWQNMRLRSAVTRWSDELDAAIDAVHERYDEERAEA